LEADIAEQPIRVGIGLIERQGAYLIRKRPPGSAMAGRWEFPGGKCEPGESPGEATARECLEEVGVEVVVGELFHRIVHRYPHGFVELHYYRCAIQDAASRPATDSGFLWVPAEELPEYHFPEANDAVIAALAREGVGWKGSLRDEP
jgi:8-oxo-dGTP diphosphatase